MAKTMANTMADAIGRNARHLSRAFVPAAAAIGAATLALSAWWLAADALRGKPAIAAEVGLVRGELWLRNGWSELQTSPEAAEAAFTRALRLSPMDAGAWFGLASATGRFDWLNPTASKALKMSYYTGFNRSDLIAPRLILLAQVDTTRDVELICRIDRSAAAADPPDPHPRAGAEGRDRAGLSRGWRRQPAHHRGGIQGRQPEHSGVRRAWRRMPSRQIPL
ncbi:hypothetical protein [Bradyrhizobium elkanii]|uniref:hypothetical protein n=1 Tax=Bradyrhizobium elkanii TaxID=29448 RepID=UPI003510E40E